MFIRIVTGIKTHFEARFVEWAMAVAIGGWGLNLAFVDTELFARTEAWAALNRVAAKDAWSTACLLSGAAWLLALTVNGTFADTVYARISPYVRGVAAVIAAVIWLQIFISVLPAGSSGRGIYWLPLGLSVWCVFHAWRDTGRGSAARARS